MKTKRLQSGFTLIELLVAMAITVILLGVLVYMTGISMDTYKKSRNEVRASRQAKEALEILSKDFESMVSRRDGNTYEWLYVGKDPRGLEGPNGNEVTNASQLIFFTGATDRYNGEIGEPADKGGDVSAVCYRLVYKDQISTTDNPEWATFSLYRHLVNPDETFGVGGANGLLAVDDLKSAYTGMFNDTKDLTASNFLVENIYEFTITFLVEVTEGSNGGTTPTTSIERVTLRQDPNASGNPYTEFRLKGDKITVMGGGSGADLTNGNIVGVEISISAITDQGLVIAKKVPSAVWEKQQGKYTYHYTKTINTPRP